MDIVIMGNCVFNIEPAFQRQLPEEARDPKKRHSDYSREEVIAVLNSKDFFFSIEPFPGAIEAVKKMVELGHNVKICVTPLPPIENPMGFAQCFQWFETQFGLEFFISRVKMDKDRTDLRADILIADDLQKGAHSPVWEPVLFETEYNKNIQGLRRINWDNWREVL